MPSKGQLFSSMHAVALSWLDGRDASEIGRLANIAFDAGAFHFQSLGHEVTVTYPSYEILPQLDQWHILTILHYLSSADGTPLCGRMISFSQQKDGMVRGGGFDRNAERIIAEKIGTLPEAELRRRITALGGVLLPSNADLCARLPYLPNYPVYLKIWFSDEDFPASGRLLLDASAEHYLSIEDAVTIGELILSALCNENI